MTLSGAFLPFQWDEKGKAVLVNAKVYEEEMKLYGEFLPELKNYQSISMLHSLLCTYGFKKKMAKASAEVHIFQHQDFTREHCNKGNDCDCSKTDLLPVTPQQKRALKKKRRNDGVVVQNNPAISPKASTTALENTNKICKTEKRTDSCVFLGLSCR
ncbi:uncharacterized protein LOC103176118 [Callorhinchus milii]|uniref:uncharacterized protein LOC103176118 n=1 Tax=Callorhinchus milii TaxID=7868 RepID=UPI001C3F691D|nr:uncharacterized protein LOC103176118 [Callorhinchus milii]